MEKIKITTKTPNKHRDTLAKFIKRYGDGHITKKAINWLRSTPFNQFTSENGNLIHVIRENKKILGVIAVGNFGLEQAIIAVHPKARNKGVAYDLTIGVLEDIDRMYVKVANDNIPSLKLCFSAGLKAFDLTKGPTGKPTLILGLGDYEQSEWRTYHKS